MKKENELPLFNHLQVKAVTMEVTMSSREIGELVEVRHDSVKRTIERLVSKGVIVQPPMVDEQITDAMGRPRKETVYQIGKRDSYVIVAQLSPEFTARLVDRWQELEEQVRQPPIDLNDPASLRMLLLGYTEKVTALEARVEEARPKVEALDRLSGLSGAMCITDAAKCLKIPPNKLFKWMDTHKWTYRRPNGRDRLPYRAKEEAGYLETRPIERHSNTTGDDFVITQVRVTAKGLTYLAQIFPPAAQLV